MFEYTTASGRLTIREACNGFYVTDNSTDETVGCGDGDSWVSEEDCSLTDAEATRLRNDRIADDIESSESQWIEAYFDKSA